MEPAIATSLSPDSLTRPDNPFPDHRVHDWSRASVGITIPADTDPLTLRSRRIWSAGDYDRIAAGFRQEADAFVARRRLIRGQQVLDAACGSGNLTIPAARTGATVTGLDLVPSLLAQTSAWAEREGWSIALDHANVEELPYDDSQFDVVMSMFGVMFAARPERVLAELARVTRKGGVVALANWTREGFIGRMFALHAAVVPPPAGVPSPLLWGDANELRERFDDRDWQLTITPRVLTFRYAHSAEKTAELFRSEYGPTVRTIEALDETQRAGFVSRLTEHWRVHNRAVGERTEVESAYVEVVAVRR